MYYNVSSGTSVLPKSEPCKIANIIVTRDSFIHAI